MPEAKIYQFQVRTIDGKDVTLRDYENKALLIVNVASECGFTYQYEGLEKLYRRYKDRGLAVLGFPCNQFGQQESGDEQEIKSFCSSKYGVSFPMFSKIDVNGPNAHPLYRYLQEEKKGVLGTEKIKWNFTKFLVDRHGAVVGRFSPNTKPEDLEGDIKAVL
jgi:glutathione peroxidase-family protein